MMKKIILLLLTLSFLFSKAQDTTVKKIIVGVKEAPPFIINEDELFTGISVELWELIANNLNYVFEYKVYKEGQLDRLFNDLKNNKIDISINPLTITSERLKNVEFSIPFYSSYVAIVLPNKEQGLSSYLKKIFSKKFWTAVFILFLVIFLMGLIIWLIERRNNHNFRNQPKGLFDGFWWAAVTMTTVGYGDKYPKTNAGKILAIIWMFSSIILISSLTGSIAAALTISEFEKKINSLEDLKKLKIGTIYGSSSYEYLKKHNIKIYKSNYKSISEGLEDVRKGKTDAFIYDQAIVKYIIENENFDDDLYLSDYKLNIVYYSFAFPKNSEITDTINFEIIKILESAYWIGILEKYNALK